MAPEQIAGSTAVDGRADVYAAGVMLFECVTGRRPYGGTSLFEILRAHVEAPVPAVRGLRAEVPAAYEAVIAKAMAKRPEDRFQTAAEMNAALGIAVQGLGAEEWVPMVVRGEDGAPVVTPRSMTPPGTTKKAVELAPTMMAAEGGGKRKAGIVIAAAVVVVVAAVVVVGVVASKTSSEPGAGSSTTTTTTTTTSTSTSTSASNSTSEAGRGTGSTGWIDADGTVHGTLVFKSPDVKSVAIAFDAKDFDAMAFLEKAEKAARDVYPDAELIGFDVDGVYPDGHADLTLSDDFDATFEFRSPSRSKRPDDLPVGVEAEIPCLIYVSVDPADGVEIYPATDEECAQPLRPRPKCTLQQVWHKAIQIGAPATGAVMEIDYLWDGWFVQIGDDFTESIPDAC
jgi:hypothetical protein